ncbi:MAG: hypothetical protein SCH70_11890 [Candidatus Methanoperedens sp.]|nr:hypothetical protein [Candidatus Methanoperedens sp.]MDW7727788.1 hypothetical protein [Candidatus Methanoperedens sp.]
MDILKLMSNNLFLKPLGWRKIILGGILISALLVIIILIIAMMGGFKGSFASIFVTIYSIIFMPLIVYGLILNRFPELHNFYSYEYDPFIGAIIYVLYWIGIFALVQKSIYKYQQLKK